MRLAFLVFFGLIAAGALLFVYERFSERRERLRRDERRQRRKDERRAWDERDRND